MNGRMSSIMKKYKEALYRRSQQSFIHVDGYQYWKMHSSIQDPCIKHNNSKQKKFFSSPAASPTADTTLSPPPKLTLKRLLRPFFLAYHPDRLASSSTLTREVNLDAIQTLNEMIDTVDALYDRAADPKYSGVNKGRVELKPKYVVEFLVENASSERAGVKRKKQGTTSTRRSIELTFGEWERRSVQTVDANGSYSINAAHVLKLKAMTEIRKLLRIAGLGIPSEIDAQLEKMNEDFEEEDELSDEERIFHSELGLDIHQQSRQRRKGRPKTPFEESRDRFTKKMDWEKHRKMCEEALEDAKRDIATQGLLDKSKERRQRMVSDILSKVRVYDRSVDATDGDAVPDPLDEHDDGLDVLQQLIAIRRMSLIFNDNFEELEFEDMGRMWENSVIVLTPVRRGTDSKTGLPFSRIKRVKQGRESGFKFSYNADENVTIHIPIDFEDDELLNELKRHLRDFFSMCMEKDGTHDFFPSYYKDMVEY